MILPCKGTAALRGRRANAQGSAPSHRWHARDGGRPPLGAQAERVLQDAEGPRARAVRARGDRARAVLATSTAARCSPSCGRGWPRTCTGGSRSSTARWSPTAPTPSRSPRARSRSCSAGLPKPVVLTGSQRPLGQLRTDARLNLIDAVTSALRGPREVTICFDSHLYRGNRDAEGEGRRVRRVREPELPGARHARGRRDVREGARRRRGGSRSGEKLDPRVFLLKVFPGLDPKLPLALLPHLRGLVVEAYGAGNFPIDEQLGRSLLPAVPRGEGARGAGGGGEPGVPQRRRPHPLRVGRGGAAELARSAAAT